MNPARSVPDELREPVIAVARNALSAGAGAAVREPSAAELAPRLRVPGASFVSLYQEGRLRGCCGHLAPTGPLGLDVWRAARASAYGDPRFPPVAAEEVTTLSMDVSILGEPEPVAARNEAELRSVLRPEIDGLVVSFGERRATFLPQVWETLPDPVDFLRELRRKAGLPADFWHETLRWSRYQVRVFRDPA
ncbi:MAG: AmmeMemoRadiSam system protein A [Gammaproteobacteria bacterium]